VKVHGLLSSISSMKWQVLKKCKSCLTIASVLAINPLNAELNPICHLLALLGAHHIFHVSGLRVKEVNNIILDDKSLCKGGQLKRFTIKRKGKPKDILN
jgi:hypothetical protein